METRKDTLCALKLCRFCLSQDETLTSLYDRSRAPKNSVTLPLKILSCVSVEVFPSDKMPAYICNRCKFFMDISYEYKQMCRQADENVMEYIQNGTNLNPLSWPSTLQKLFRVATKSELAVMKTIIEGGATVQVTAQETDSEEEEEDDEENVYNIKIGDGSNDGPKNARVKVITAEKQSKLKGKQAKGFPSVTKLQRHVRTHAGDRSYPCKFCTKSFIKSHHYTRHLRLKHRETNRTCRGPFGESEPYRCEQCEDTFSSQDELIFHSAIHATQNLTCPLCQEKFPNVEAVTSHIKSHVNGSEFMCDMCELIFTTKEKLDTHFANAHDDEELRNEELDESSMDMEGEDFEDEAGINVKDEGDHMVVEIKKADDFMLSNMQGEGEEKLDNTNSEESDPEMTFTELSNVDTLTLNRKESTKPNQKTKAATTGGAILTKTMSAEKNESQTAPILRRAEEIKRKAQLTPEPVSDKKMKGEGNNTGASDKSLRLLEKELQELKRTNTRSDTVKTPVSKPVEMLRNRRPQIHTSTPKSRTPVEEKKTPVTTKSPAPEKKAPERRVITKENKEPKEVKDTKGNNGSVKEDKEKEVTKEKEKEAVKEKEKEVAKEKETPNKTVVKNGANEKNTSSEEGVRRSTRPSKIKDYAKMIRDRTQDSDEEDDSDEFEEEYKDTEKSIETKPKPRRASTKPVPKPVVTPPAANTPAPRKRGRPRKDGGVATPVPAKIKKDDNEAQIAKSEVAEKESENVNKPKETPTVTEKSKEKTAAVADSKNTENKPLAETKTGILVSPTGQTLKKIPVKSLPPGVKALPLPANARLGGGEVCEMQIGKKVVKVQKIVMTKAEVEAMAKRGLVEMKDGTMVLKQGIKIPTSDPVALKTLVADEAGKESPSKKATPTRCDIEEEATA